MSGFTKFMKKKSGKAWAIAGGSVLAIAAAVSIVATMSFRQTIGTILGGLNPIFDPSVAKVYESSYASKKELLAASKELNKQIEQEGSVLLLNEIENGKAALPLAKNAKISVFGKNSANLVLSGSGSGNAGSDGAISLYQGLENGGFQLNPSLKDFYSSSASGAGRSSNPQLTEGSTKAPTLDIGETPVSSYTPELKASFAGYHDAAVVVISRIGGESFDLPRSQNPDNGGIEGNHYLQLDKNEYDLLDMVTTSFDKVIVLLNTLTSFQLDFLREYNNLAGESRIDAVLWVGGPGVNGADGIAGVLNGEVNPSGKTTDVFARDFTKDPTWKNFGDNSQNFDGVSSAAFTENGENVSNNFMVRYQEGIYVGYKYYETRGYEEAKIDGDYAWYHEAVVFPFGHGLSYTTFTQEMAVSGDVATGLNFTVTVKNTGSVAGKDVVQLYVTLPYIQGGIEKSRVQLADFAKTKLLDPNTTETIAFHVDPYDLASYDYNDANENHVTGYELEAGDYIFYAGRDSHVDETSYAHAVKHLDNGMTFLKDPKTNEDVVNRYTTDDFSDIQYRLDDNYITAHSGAEVQRKGMSRTNFAGTFPKAPDKDAREYRDGEKAYLADRTHNNAKVKEINDMPTTRAEVKYKLRDLMGLPYHDTKWDELLDSLSYEDMINLVNYGDFKTQPILSIEKNLTNDSDGPVGFVNFMPGLSEHYKDNPTFASEIVIASTWNKDLAYAMGKMVGESGLLGDIGGNNLPYTGWYAPAVNIHRSPFAGRNYEYYSEDPILSGKMAVNVINGAASKGVISDLKHFALNDQETNRSGVATYCTEQALREIYLKPFELGVKGADLPIYSATAKADGLTAYAGTKGIMSSFNRIGAKWTGGDYRLLTEILRDEWGFAGLVICDYKTDNTVMDSRQMLYAGNDLILTTLDSLRWNDSSAADAKDVYVLRAAAHNILYAVGNSNSVNVRIIGYNLETWVQVMIWVDVAIAVIVAGFGVLGTLRARKQKEE